MTCQRRPSYPRPIVPRNECIRNGRRRRGEGEKKGEEEEKEASARARRGAGAATDLRMRITRSGCTYVGEAVTYTALCG